MKERENREFWIRQTTALPAMSINRYLYISLYCYCKVSSGSPKPGPRLNQTIQAHLSPCTGPTVQDILDYKQDVFLLYKNSYQGRFPWTP